MSAIAPHNMGVKKKNQDYHFIYFKIFHLSFPVIIDILFFLHASLEMSYHGCQLGF